MYWVIKMGEAIVFHTKEEQEILLELAKKEAEKGLLLTQQRGLRDAVINEALDDINADIEELLKILEDKAQENKSRSEINRRILHKRKF